MAEPLPALYALTPAEVASLGEFQLELRTGSQSHKVNLAITGVFTLLLGAAAVWLGIDALTGEPGRGIGGAALLFGGLAILPAAGLIWLALKLRWRLALFQNGFVQLKHGRQLVLWKDVESLFLGGINIDQKIVFQLTSGARITADNSYRDYSRFADEAREVLGKQITERSLATLGSQEAVTFGRWKIRSSGIEEKGKSPLAWKQVERISLDERVDGQVIYHALALWTKPAGSAEPIEWSSERVSNIPNFDALINLLRHLTGQSIDS